MVNISAPPFSLILLDQEEREVVVLGKKTNRDKEEISGFVRESHSGFRERKDLLNICILYAQKRPGQLQIFTATSCQPWVVKHVVWDSKRLLKKQRALYTNGSGLFFEKSPFSLFFLSCVFLF